MMSIAGKKLSDVISSKICIVTEYSVEPSGPVVTVTAGKTPSAAHADGMHNRITNPTNARIRVIIVLISPDVADSQRNQTLYE